MKNSFKFRIVAISLFLIGLFISFILETYFYDYVFNDIFNINGLILGILVITVSIIVSRYSYIEQPKSSYFQIILDVLIVTIISELIFQIFRQFTMESYSLIDRIETVGRAILIMGIFSSIVSFLTIFYMKIRNLGYLILLIIGVLVGFNIIMTLI